MCGNLQLACELEEETRATTKNVFRFSSQRCDIGWIYVHNSLSVTQFWYSVEAGVTVQPIKIGKSATLAQVHYIDPSLLAVERAIKWLGVL